MGRKSTRKQLEADNISARRLSTSPRMCTCDLLSALRARKRTSDRTTELILENSVQVNIPAESGEMGILANHAPTIEPLRPGVVEVIESGNTSKKWFGEFVYVLPPRPPLHSALVSFGGLCYGPPQ